MTGKGSDVTNKEQNDGERQRTLLIKEQNDGERQRRY